MARAKEVMSKGVELELDGKKYLIRYTMNSMIEMEDRFGSVENIGKLQTENPSLKTIRFLIWLGLQYKHPELTEEDIGNMIDMTEMPMIAETIHKAFKDSQPEEAEGETENLNPIK